MEALRKGDLVDQLLREAGEISCHSQFSHGVNLKVGDQLLFVGDAQKGCVPFGIHLSTADFSQLNQHNWQGSIKQISSGLRIAGVNLMLTCPIYDSRLTMANQGLFKVRASHYHVLTHYLEGTGLDFRPLMTAPIFRQPTRELSVGYMNHYIGRGLGLTPAGDDFTIGLLAVDEIQPFLPEDFRHQLVLALNEKRTTAISESYLRSAAEGHFSSLVKDVIRQLGGNADGAMLALAASGSTSGCDTLAGIFYGLQHLQETSVADGAKEQQV